MTKEYAAWWRSFAPALTGFSVKNSIRYVQLNPPIPIIDLVTLNITRLVISPISSVWQPLLCSNLGTKLAHTLVHLNIVSIRDCPKEYVFAMMMPILPKLKVFKLSRVPYGEERWSGKIPQITLTYESQVLNYAVQFPALESIIVEKDWSEGKFEGQDLLSDGTYFEALVPFLYNSFMAEGTTPCGTLKRLDIPFPAGVKFRVAKCISLSDACNNEDDAKSDYWEWKDTAEFFERVRTTFPNLGYHVLDKKWREERTRGVEEFVRMGRKYGFLEDDIHMMMRKGDLLGG
ncbi:uncharacterized protein LOC118438967 [Folsomia candida]|nr:uncharacterized protein LOC118438967 [Folsomia candida]